MPGSTYISTFLGATGVGNVRYDTSRQQMQVYDGTNWIELQMGTTNIGLSSEAESLLEWVRKYQDEEQQIEMLSKNNEAVRIAVENLNKAKAQLKATVILAKDYENETTS